MEPCIVVETTVNHCHYEGDATIIQMALSRALFLCRQIIDSNRCTFAFSEYITHTIHVFPMDKIKWLFKN